MGLPDHTARLKMIQAHLPDTINSGHAITLACHADRDALAQKTEGYSGSDIRLVCKEAAMRRVRDVFAILESRAPHRDLTAVVKLKPVTDADVDAALKITKPSSNGFREKYTQWQTEYESA